MTQLQTLQAFEACLNGDTHLKCRLANSANSLHSFVHTSGHRSQSESDRMEYLCFNFVKSVEGLFPKGQISSCVLTRGGKIIALDMQYCNRSIAHARSEQSLGTIKGVGWFLDG